MLILACYSAGIPTVGKSACLAAFRSLWILFFHAVGTVGDRQDPAGITTIVVRYTCAVAH
jgi:hypothetical protein